MVGRVGLDAAYDVHPAEDLAEDDVSLVKPWCGSRRDEELPSQVGSVPLPRILNKSEPTWEPLEFGPELAIESMPGLL